MDAIDRLEAWAAGHKCRWVEVQVGNGYGATCWSVGLYTGQRDAHPKVCAQEVAFVVDPETPEWVVYAAADTDDGWPGLAKTIHAAVDRWEQLYPVPNPEATT